MRKEIPQKAAGEYTSGGGSATIEAFDYSKPLEEWSTEMLKEALDQLNDRELSVPKEKNKQIEREKGKEKVLVDKPDNSELEGINMADWVKRRTQEVDGKIRIKEILIARGELPDGSVTGENAENKGKWRKLREAIGGEKVKRKFEAKDVEESILASKEIQLKGEVQSEYDEKLKDIKVTEQRRDDVMAEAKKIGQDKADAEEIFKTKVELLGENPDPAAIKAFEEKKREKLDAIEAREQSAKDNFEKINSELEKEHAELEEIRKKIAGNNDKLRDKLEVEKEHIEKVTDIFKHREEDARLRKGIAKLSEVLEANEKAVRSISAILENQSSFLEKDEKEKLGARVKELQKVVKETKDELEEAEKELDVVNDYLIAIELRTKNMDDLAIKHGFDEAKDPKEKKMEVIEELKFNKLFTIPKAQQKNPTPTTGASTPSSVTATTAAMPVGGKSGGGGFERPTLKARQERREKRKTGFMAWLSNIFGGPASPNESKEDKI